MKRSAAFLVVALTMMSGHEHARAGRTDERAAFTRAAAQRAQRVCRARVSLRHAPAGVRIGYLQRGDRVIVVLHARRRLWAYVLSAAGNGWLLTSALCRR